MQCRVHHTLVRNLIRFFALQLRAEFPSDPNTRRIRWIDKEINLLEEIAFKNVLKRCSRRSGANSPTKYLAPYPISHTTHIFTGYWPIDFHRTPNIVRIFIGNYPAVCLLFCPKATTFADPVSSIR